jgi:hypothetical protein
MPEKTVRVLFEGIDHLSNVYRGVARESQSSAAKQTKANEETAGSMELVRRQAERTRSAFAGLTTGLIGAGGLAYGLTSVVKAGLQLQQSTNQLQNSLTGLGIRGSRAASAISEITTRSEDLSRTGAGSTEEMVAGYGKLLLTQGKGLAMSERLRLANLGQKAAVGLVTSQHLSYQSALALVQSAEIGRLRGIQKYVGVVTPVKTAEEALTLSVSHATLAQKAAAVQQDRLATGQEAVTRLVQRTARAHASQSQQLAGLRYSFQNLEANLGTALLPILSKVTKALSDLFGWLGKHKTLVQDLAIAFGFFASVILAGRFVSALRTSTGELTRMFGATLTLARRMVGIGDASDAAAAGERAAGTAAQVAVPKVAELAAAYRELAKYELQAKEAGGLGPGLGGAGKAAAAGTAAETGAADAAKAAEAAKGASTFAKLGGKVAGWASDVLKPIGKVALPVAAFMAGVSALTAGGSAFNRLKSAVSTVDPTTLIPGYRGLGVTVLDAVKAALGHPSLPGSEVRRLQGLGGGRFAVHGLSGGLVTPTGLQRFQTGGVVGPTSVDQIPAMLALGEGILNRTAMANLGVPGLTALNAGQPLPAGEVHYAQPIVVKLDSRVLANAVVQQTLKRGVFGPSSLVGGQLVTGGL